MPGIFGWTECYAGEKKHCLKAVFEIKKYYCQHLPGGSSKVCPVPSYRNAFQIYITRSYKSFTVIDIM